MEKDYIDTDHHIIFNIEPKKKRHHSRVRRKKQYFCLSAATVTYGWLLGRCYDRVSIHIFMLRLTPRRS